MEYNEFYYNSPDGLTSFSYAPPRVPENTPPNSAVYQANANKYREWLAREGYNLPEDLRRLKRRQILSSGIKQQAVGNSDNFFMTPEADVFRRQYELTRRSRPNLTPKGAFNVTLANEPGILRNMTPEQLLQLASRYVVQDSRSRGNAPDSESNATYDSVMLGRDVSDRQKSVYSGATNWASNFVYPVFDTAGDILGITPRLASTALRIPPNIFRRLGILDPRDYTHVDMAADATDGVLDWAKRKSIGWIPRKAETADKVLGQSGYDRTNRLISGATRLATIPLIGGRMYGSASAALPLSLAGVKLHPNLWKTFKSLGGNTWQRANNLYGKYLGFNLAKDTASGALQSGKLLDDYYAGNAGIFGPDIDIDDNKKLVTATRGSDTHVPVLDLDGVSYGTDIKPNNLGLVAAASTLPKDHPIRKRVSDTFRRKIIEANASGYPRIDLDSNGNPKSNYTTRKPITASVRGK